MEIFFAFLNSKWSQLLAGIAAFGLATYLLNPSVPLLKPMEEPDQVIAGLIFILLGAVCVGRFVKMRIEEISRNSC